MSKDILNGLRKALKNVDAKGETVAALAKLAGLDIEEAKDGLEELVSTGKADKRGKRYVKADEKKEPRLRSASHFALKFAFDEALADAQEAKLAKKKTHEQCVGAMQGIVESMGGSNGRKSIDKARAKLSGYDERFSAALAALSCPKKESRSSSRKGECSVSGKERQRLRIRISNVEGIEECFSKEQIQNGAKWRMEIKKVDGVDAIVCVPA